MKWTPPEDARALAARLDRSARHPADRLLGVPPVSRTYWRCLAPARGPSRVPRALEREFPEGASELPDGITRREMMTLIGASLSLAGLAGCRRPVERSSRT